MRQSPRDSDTRVALGGSGDLNVGGFRESSDSGSIGSLRFSNVLGYVPSDDGAYLTRRLEGGAETWSVFNDGLAQGVRFTDGSLGLSWAESWSQEQLLSDRRLVYGVGLFLTEASIGTGSNTSFESTGFGVEATGEYEARCGSGESWDLTGFVGGGLQLGGVNQRGAAVDASGSEGSSQVGLALQAGLRCSWDTFFVETAYLYRYVDVGFLDLDVQGGMVSVGVRW